MSLTTHSWQPAQLMKLSVSPVLTHSHVRHVGITEYHDVDCDAMDREGSGLRGCYDMSTGAVTAVWGSSCTGKKPTARRLLGSEGGGTDCFETSAVFSRYGVTSQKI